MLEFLNWPEFGKGTERTCYRNPETPDRCIKVSIKSQSKQSRREIKYYQFLAKRKVSYEHIPKFYREVDEGDYLGLEMEFVCNADGSGSPNLHQYLQQPLTPEQLSTFLQELEKVKHYLIDNNIVPCDLVANNLLVTAQRDGIKIIMVDGLGGTELIPLSNYFPYFGRRKIERKWDKFMRERVMTAIEQFQKK